MRVCECVCVCESLCVCVCGVCLYESLCVSVCVRACESVSLCVCVCLYESLCVSVFVRVCVWCVCVRANQHKNTYKHVSYSKYILLINNCIIINMHNI